MRMKQLINIFILFCGKMIVNKLHYKRRIRTKKIKGKIIVVNDHQTYEKLIEVLSEKNVMVNEPLKNHTYTHLGGKADFFVTPETYEQVQQIVKLANKEK